MGILLPVLNILLELLVIIILFSIFISILIINYLFNVIKRSGEFERNIIKNDMCFNFSYGWEDVLMH